MSVSRIVTWSVILTVVLLLLGIVSSPLYTKTSAGTPYVSALDELAATPAYAACPLQKCQARGHNGFVCVHASNFSECLISGTSCNTQSCTIQ